MKQTYILILLTSLLISCESRKTIEVNQIKSKEMVTILPNLKKIKDSVPICVPLEFEIKINSPVYYINWFYSENNKLLENSFDYLVYNRQNRIKPLSQLDFDESFSERSTIIILKKRNYLISKKKMWELLKKYNIDKSLDGLKFGDTIKITTYDKFRSQNKYFINDLNKTNDSVKFRGMKKDGKFFYLSKKIIW